MDDSERPTPNLDDNYLDKLIAIGKGVAGAFPFVGGAIGEIVGLTIPGQRADRIAAYLRALSARVERMDQDTKSSLTSCSEKIDIIEEGGFQAARATSKERINMIIEAVSRGLQENESETVRRKRILQILGELDEDELILLHAYGLSYGGMEPDPFEKVNRPPPTHLGSSQDELDKQALFHSGQDHLLRLKLLKKNYGNVKKGQIPEFNAKEGDFKNRIEISPLGRILLKEIGTPSPFDQQKTNEPQ